MQFDRKLESYIDLVLKTYQEYTGEILAADINELFKANFCCASHYFHEDGTKFIFGNSKALALWEMTWDEFTKLESKYSANKEERAQRENLLENVKEQGIITNYEGVRVSKTGKEFLIKGAIVWNVKDKDDNILGQAVKFKDFSYIVN